EQYFPPLELGFFQHQEHQLEHHHHQQHHHGHSDIRAEPTISYQVLYPYTPPQMDDRASMPEQTAEVSQSKIMEVPVVYRDYKVYETHYTEEPLTSVNPENPPVDHYFASMDIKGPELTYSDTNRNDSHYDSVAGPGAGSSEVIDTDNGLLPLVEEHTASKSLFEVSSEEQTMFNQMEKSTEEIRGHAQNGEDDENGNITEKVTIFVDLWTEASRPSPTYLCFLCVVAPTSACVFEREKKNGGGGGSTCMSDVCSLPLMPCCKCFKPVFRLPNSTVFIQSVCPWSHQRPNWGRSIKCVQTLT
ncbi:unnamed protein product, partial [Candidula unifasciata]